MRFFAGIFCAILCLGFGNKTIAQISFDLKSLQFNGNGSISSGTSLEFGPDDRLYVTEVDGDVKIFTIQYNLSTQAYEVTDYDLITDVKNIPNHNDDGTPGGPSTRQVTGIAVGGTASNPVMYVSSSDSRVGAGGGGGDKDLDTNSGVITRLSWNGTDWDVVDIVRGLPRSEENHATNDMDLVTIGGTEYLIVCSGGFTNAGAPSNNFAYITEYVMAAAVLSVNLDMIESMPILTDASSGRDYVYDLPTLDDPTRANVNGVTDPDDPAYDGVDINDPWGGNDGLNQSMLVVGSPVEMFSPGYRNTYDLVITEDRHVYVTDNGANGGWGGYPEYEADATNVSNTYRSGEPGSTGADSGPNNSPYDAQVNNSDHLNLVTTDIDNYVFGSVYGGHPCPLRANPDAGLYTRGTHSDAGPGLFFTDDVFRTQVYDPDGSTPGSSTDPEAALPANWPPVDATLLNPDNADFRQPSLSGNANPDGPEDIIVVNWGNNTNAIDEYTASNFGGVMQGDLIAGKSGGSLHRIDRDATGAIIGVEQNTFSTGGGNPLGVTCQGDNDIFPGSIWIATFNSEIKILKPTDVSDCIQPNEQGYDPIADYDNDGYTNSDEIDNGTDHCNGGSVPSDNDGDDVSDLNDLDDDNDGTLDESDPFQLYNYGLNANAQAVASLPIDNELFSQQLDGNGQEIGYLGLGLTGLMNNGDPNPNYQNWLDDPLASGTDVDDIYGGAIGAMTIYHTTGDATGAQNDQEKAFQQAAAVGTSSGPFEVSAAMFPPFHSWSTTESQGLFIGPGTQSDFIKLVLTSDGSNDIVQVVTEDSDVSTPGTSVPITIPGNVNSIELYFNVDPATGSVQPQFSIDGGTRTNVGAPFNATGATLTAIQDINTLLAVGVIGTADVDDNFASNWDFIRVLASAPYVAQTLPDLDRLIDDPDEDIDLDNYFDDDNGTANLTYTVEANTNPSVGASITGNILTLTYPSSPANTDVTIRATDQSSLFVEQTFNVDVTDEPVPVIRIRANGATITSTDAPNPDWLGGLGSGAQNGSFNGIAYAVNTGNLSTHNITGRDASVPAYVPQSLFANERWDPAGTAPDMEWTFDLPNGNYLVRLYMGNGFSGTSQPGERVFDIFVEGQLVQDNLDLSATFGHQVGGMLEYPVALSDGTINIQFGAEVENPTVNGIEVLSIGGALPPPPIAVQPVPNQLNQEGDQANLAVSASGGDPVENFTYSISGQPAGVQIEPTNGLIFGTIAAGAATGGPNNDGVYPVTVTVDKPSSTAVNTQFTWTVIVGASDAEALVEITPNNTNINASTFGNGSFQITNNSGSGQLITSITFDMSTGFLPNMVFDPAGTAGDLTAKPFTENQGVGGTTNHTLSQPLGNGGFQQLDVTFTDFAQGETYTFSIDQDPTSIEGLGAPGPNESGSVSGLEQVASTITVNFSDGSSFTTNLYSDGSNAGATTVARQDLPAAPVISMVGLASPGTTNQASQTIQITGGPANGTISLLQVEAGFFEGGNDLNQEPYEVNSVISLNRTTGIQLDGSGNASVAVTLTDSDPEAGYNYFVASVEDGADFGLTSNPVIVLYDDQFVPPVPAQVLYRVNTGGALIAASDAPNPDWSEDTGSFGTAGNSPYLTANSTGGSTFSQTSGSAYQGPIIMTDPSLIGTNVPSDVFTTERYDGSTNPPAMQWNFPVGPNETIEVRLYFCEIFSSIDQAGERVFDVAVEGVVPPQFDDIDQFASNGPLGAFMRSYTTTVTDGNLTLQFNHGVENPAIKAIEILGQGTNTTPVVDGAAVINEVINSTQSGVNVVVATNGLSILSNGLNTATVNTTNVVLKQGAQIITGTSVNADADGDDIILSAQDLSFGTTYTFEVTSGVQDGDGNGFEPFTFDFTTDAGGSVAQTNVQFDQTEVATGTAYTNLEIGPDGKLYGLSVEGLIDRWDINPDGTLANKESITSLQSGGNRLALGMAFDPASTSGNLILWVTHSDFAFSGAQPNSGVLSQLTGANLQTVTDYVTGLPRAENAHATNDITFDASGNMYISQGHTAGAGEPGATGYGTQPELPLSAAILSVDISAISPPFDASTADGTTGPVVPFATGVRNAFGLVYHSNGQLYAPVNGAEGGNPVPPHNGNPSFNLTSDPFDYLIRVEPDGYYGHPNPARNEFILNGGNPTAGQDPGEINDYPVGTLPEASYAGYAYAFGDSEAPGSIIEYQNNGNAAALQGKLLTVRYNQSFDLVALTTGGSKGDIIGVESLVSGFLGGPLALVENTVNGDLYISEYTAGTIQLLRPAAPTNTTPLVTNPGTQTNEDGDVVSLQILASDTDPCTGLTYSATGLPPSLSIDPNTGLISGTLDEPTSGTTGAFQEQGGLLVIEMESGAPLPNSWEDINSYSTTFSPDVNDPTGAAGDNFIIWQAGQNLSNPGVGTITYPIEITTPGTYQFQWRNQVGNGTNTTEHNDTWLKINADVFYGEQSGGSIVCPNGAPPSNQCVGGSPNGSSSGGWFKVYSSGANNWSWSTNTSDNDAHQIYATFNNPGFYEIQISARSSSHAIDRMVMYQSGVSNPLNLSNPESPFISSNPVAGASDGSPYTVTVSVTDGCTPPLSTDAVFQWDVNPAGTSGTPSALLEITPGGGLGASTYGSSSIQLGNTSTGSVQISSISIDLSTGILPDNVFDPVGTGGDATASCFTPNSGASAVGLIAPADPCVDPFSVPRNGGFDVMTVNFNDFDPSEQFNFTVDVDPNSIQGVPGAGNAGAVSGYELVGATITIEFSDGTTVVSNLFEDGSLGGGQAVVAENATASPVIAAVGLNAPAIVTDPNQAIEISGTPGDYFALLQMDSRLFIASGDPPFNVPDETFYSNEAMSGKAVITGIIDPDGTTEVPVTLFLTDGPNATPDGGKNYFIAVTSEVPYVVDQQVSQTSNVLILKYDPNAAGADLTINVELQGRTDHTGDYLVKLCDPNVGTEAYIFNGTAGANGQMTFTGIAPATYDIYVDRDQYISRVQTANTLVSGANVVDFTAANGHELRAGNFNDAVDNLVSALDFSGLVTTFNLASGDSGYNGNADFNGDDLVSALDFSLLVTNFNTQGDELCSGNPVNPPGNPEVESRSAPTDDASILFEHAGTPYRVGDEIRVECLVQRDGAPIDAAQLDLNYDTQVLQLQEITWHADLPNKLLESVEEGKVSIAAGALTAFPENRIRLVTLVFQAINEGWARIEAGQDALVTWGGAGLNTKAAALDIPVTSPEEIPVFTVFPNPTSGAVSIATSGFSGYDTADLELYDLNGKLLLSELIGLNNTRILDLDMLQSGTYVIKLVSSERTFSELLIISK